MYAWLRAVITTATTRAIYGPMNPYNDQVVTDAFWQFERGIISLYFNAFPLITARSTIAARDKVVRAFEKYYSAQGPEYASDFAKNRFHIQMNHGIPLEDIARYEVAGTLAIINTIPAAFWVIILLHKHSDLLEDVRKEIDCSIRTTLNNGHTIKTINTTALKETCPLLLSFYQEVLRHCSEYVSVREVLEDTWVDQWLLKRGAIVHMSSKAIHYDVAQWGPEAAAFRPRRFLPEERARRPRDAYFRAFGGGKGLCPGRHFATDEILALVAGLVTRLDLQPVGGSWKLPTTTRTDSVIAMMVPDDDVEVVVRTRPGYEYIEWVIESRRSDEILAMVDEDIIHEES
ncbi:cytochrome P450 [Nemania sp. FL0916]|nr:cytochrome P450 [Nemania sp. FL0916]